MIFRFLITALSVFSFCLLQSCTIEEHIHFTDNDQGNVKFTIDMSKMAAMMKSMKTDSTGESKGSNIDDSLDSLSKSGMGDLFEDIEGISNFQSDVDTANYIISFSYDFESMEALNKSMAKAEEKEHEDENYVVPADHEYFKISGNTFFYEAPEIPTAQDTTTADESLKQMAGMYEFIMKITFEGKEIKSVENDKFNIMEDNKGLVYRGSMMEVLDNQKLLNTKVKLKN